MTAFKHATAIMLCLLCATRTLASPPEITISFQVDGQTVVGTLELPSTTGRAPVILMLHGFKGSRDELMIPSLKEGIFKRAADAWADRGLASLRIDFRGGGASGGAFEDTTISGQVKDALAAIDFLQTEKSVDPRRMALVGWSQGGAVAETIAGRTSHPIRAVTLWNPMSSPAAVAEAIFGVETVKVGVQGGSAPITVRLPWGGQTMLKPAYFEDLYRLDPVAEFARYSGPAFVAVGTTDTVIYPQPDSGKTLLAYHHGQSELWVRPMDHAFNVFQETRTLDALIAATGNFFTKAMQH